MEKKTYIIKTGEQSGCLKTKQFMADAIDEITIHYPESVVELDGWHDNLYTKAAVDDARARGQREAWELAQKILNDVKDGGYSTKDLMAIFNKTSMGYAMCAQVIAENTFTDARGKIQKWEEKKKHPLEVGTVITNGRRKGIITRIRSVGTDHYHYTVLYEDGACGWAYDYDIKTTDSKVDIGEILKIVKGETE